MYVEKLNKTRSNKIKMKLKINLIFLKIGFAFLNLFSSFYFIFLP